jgi:predicted dehydrogenase
MALRLGIIGCGVIGRFHAQAADGDDWIDLAAVADIDDRAARNLAETYDVSSVYGEAAELIADPNIDAVVLALLTGVRTPIALAALRAGKHVLLEKPPAMSANDLRAMKASANGLVVGCCSSRFSFLDGAERARAEVESGTLGNIRIVRCRGIGAVGPFPKGHTPPPWRVSHSLNGGGYMVNWGVYDLDYLMHVTAWQLKPRTVLAQTWPIAPGLADGRVDPASDAENHVISFIHCDNNAVIVHERGEAVAMESKLGWSVTGDRASLRLSMTPRADGPQVVLDEADPVDGLRTSVLLDAPGVNRSNDMPVRDFAAAIRDGRPPRTDLRKATIIQQVIDAIYTSSRSGRAVDIDSDYAQS